VVTLASLGKTATAARMFRNAVAGRWGRGGAAQLDVCDTAIVFMLWVPDGFREPSTVSNEVFAILMDRGDHGNAGVEDVGCALGERVQALSLSPCSTSVAFSASTRVASLR
jgi:hypothetical protein